MKMIRRGVIATVGLVVIAAVTVGLSRLEPAAPSVDRRTLWLDSVKRGSMLRQVRGVGTLVSEDILVVPALVSGRVTYIRVLPGAIVDANTVILELSNPDLERELLDATSQLNSAKARLSAQRTSLQDQLLGNEASLAQYQASCDEARLRAEVNQKQFEQDLIPELELTLSNTNAERAKRLLEINQRRFEMFEKETVPAQLAELQESVSQAESLCELKRRQIESLKVRAGTNGVLAQVKDKIEPGQQIAPGVVLARDVLIGLPAEVDTYNGTVQGAVSRIDPTVIEGNVTVDVTLDGALPKGARPDLSVTGTIEIERLEDIFYDGRPVFASSEGVSELFRVVEEGRFAIRTRVRFGRVSVITIEVLDGLDVGDEIILSDMSQWDGQDRIRLK
jgi:HlyD family secretion protein